MIAEPIAAVAVLAVVQAAVTVAVGAFVVVEETLPAAVVAVAVIVVSVIQFAAVAVVTAVHIHGNINDTQHPIRLRRFQIFQIFQRKTSLQTNITIPVTFSSFKTSLGK